MPEAFRFIKYGTAAGIPISVMLRAALRAGIHYLASCFRVGRWPYAVGHNSVVANDSCAVELARCGRSRDDFVQVVAGVDLSAGAATCVAAVAVTMGLPEHQCSCQRGLAGMLGATYAAPVVRFGAFGHSAEFLPIAALEVTCLFGGQGNLRTPLIGAVPVVTV